MDFFKRFKSATNTLRKVHIANDQVVCLFLGLPLELRQQIYGYLLSTKYNRQDVLHKAPQIGWNHPETLHRPGHVYHFQTAILRTNRQIHKEASAIFHKTNQFVFVSHDYEMLIHFGLLEWELKSMGLKDIFEQRGFPILAMDETARDFKHYAMELMVGGILIEESWRPAKPENWRRCQMFMIACDDLEQFCGVVLYINHFLSIPDSYSASTRILLCLSVDIIAQDYQKPIPSKNDTAVPSSIQRLLEPLRRLHGVGGVLIKGPASEIYKGKIRRSVMRGAPTADEMITTACTLKTEGDDAFRSADFWSSVYAYEKAISEIEAVQQPYPCSALVKEGSYSGWLVLNAVQHLHNKLRLDVVSAFVRLHEYHRAHNWTMVELWSRTGLTWNTGAVSDTEVAELWYLKAQASKGLGKIDRAHHELERALVLAPYSKDIAADFGNLTLHALRTSKAKMMWARSSRK